MKSKSKGKELANLFALHEEMRSQPKGKIGDAIGYFSNLHLLPGQFGYVIDIPAARISAHKGFDTVLGYSEEQVSLSLLYDIFHPDEAEMMRALVSRAWRFLAAHRFKLFELQFSLDYRIRKANGEYIRVLRQSTNAETDHQGISTATISICSDITHIKNSGPVSYKIFSALNDNLLADDLVKASLVNFSERELEILSWLAKGATSESIAKSLNLSIHTVNTHRKNMLKKAEMSTASELILYAVTNRLI